MKRIFILTAIILAIIFNLHAQETEASKLMLYSAQKKSGTTAVVLSCLVSSTGHAYAGNWGRGLAFTAGRVGCGIIAMTLGFEEKTETYDDGWYEYSETTIEITPMYYFGVLGASVLAIWEMVDASKEVQKYNSRLYEKITGKKLPITLNIAPMKMDNGNFSPGLALTYNF